jgi:AraC family transcriptional regulator
MRNSSPARLDDGQPSTERGLVICRPAATEATPNHFRENVEILRLSPTRSIGIGSRSSLKAACWHTDIREVQRRGDPNYVTIVLHRGGGRVWRNQERTPNEAGSVGMLPFESSNWHFEGTVSFMNVYMPFNLLGDVCESLFDRRLTHEQLWIPMGTRDDCLCNAMRRVQDLLAMEPTNLILDSWALILSEILVWNFSSHAGKRPRTPSGTLPARGIAHVVDFIEAHIDQDLNLSRLAKVAAMSVYHFARRFKETAGVSPHAYVVSRRVGRAQHMLQRGKSRLVDIATECGFSSQVHLTTVFRRELGVTPGEYRRAVCP